MSVPEADETSKSRPTTSAVVKASQLTGFVQRLVVKRAAAKSKNKRERKLQGKGSADDTGLYAAVAHEQT